MLEYGSDNTKVVGSNPAWATYTVMCMCVNVELDELCLLDKHKSSWVESRTKTLFSFPQ